MAEAGRRRGADLDSAWARPADRQNASAAGTSPQQPGGRRLRDGCPPGRGCWAGLSTPLQRAGRARSHPSTRSVSGATSMSSSRCKRRARPDDVGGRPDPPRPSVGQQTLMRASNAERARGGPRAPRPLHQGHLPAGDDVRRPSPSRDRRPPTSRGRHHLTRGTATRSYPLAEPRPVVPRCSATDPRRGRVRKFPGDGPARRRCRVRTGRTGSPASGALRPLEQHRAPSGHRHPGRGRQPAPVPVTMVCRSRRTSLCHQQTRTAAQVGQGVADAGAHARPARRASAPEVRRAGAPTRSRPTPPPSRGHHAGSRPARHRAVSIAHGISSRVTSRQGIGTGSRRLGRRSLRPRTSARRTLWQASCR